MGPVIRKCCVPCSGRDSFGLAGEGRVCAGLAIADRCVVGTMDEGGKVGRCGGVPLDVRGHVGSIVSR